MSETITGYQTIAQTLSAVRPDVNISGTVYASGPAGAYNISSFHDSFSAAVFAPAAGSFSIINTGLVEAKPTSVTAGSTNFNYGIVLGGSGHITNSGTIIGAGGVAALGTHASHIDNAGRIAGTEYYGIGMFNSAGTVLNSGSVTGHEIGIELSSGGMVSNALSGFILSVYGSGVAANGKATVVNAGTISGSTGVALLNNQGIVINTGTIETLKSGPLSGSYAGVVGYQGGTIVNSGIISGTTGVILTGGGGTLVNAGLIEGSGSYAVQFAQGFNNLLVVNSGETFVGTVDGGNIAGGAGDSTFELGTGGGTISGLGAAILDFQTIAFMPGNSWSVAGDVAGLASGESITGFAKGDLLTLSDFAANTGIQTIGTGGTLVLASATAAVSLDFASANAGEAVQITADHANGTSIELENALCFAKGTRLFSARGEVAVQELAEGELIKTLHHGWQPIVWIGVRSYDGRFIAGNHLALPVCIRRGAIAENIPSRDLMVSPGHGIFIGNVLFPAWRLINGVSITQAANFATVDYYHIELAGHEVLLAENCPAESFLDGHGIDRRQFQNAGAFNRGANLTGAPNPLARVESGFHLRAVQQSLCVRAGISVLDEIAGTLVGYVDEAKLPLVAGWAQCAEQPEVPVTLDILVNDRRMAQVLANQYRADLRAAGIGSGCHGFTVTLPKSVIGYVEVRRSLDQAKLERTDSARVRAA